MIGDAGMCAWEGDVVGAGMRECTVDAGMRAKLRAGMRAEVSAWVRVYVMLGEVDAGMRG